jgi:hypothetical protein
MKYGQGRNTMKWEGKRGVCERDRQDSRKEKREIG